MKKWKRRVQRFSIIVLCAMATFTVFVAFIYSFRSGNIQTQTMISNYNSGWFYYKDGEKIDLDFSNRVKLKTGETLIIYNTLPSDIPDGYVIAFYSLNSEVIASIDGIKVYEYDVRSSVIGGKSSPNNWNLINVDSTDSSKQIELSIHSNYNFYNGRVNDIYMGNEGKVRNFLLNNSLFDCIFGIVLFAMGIVFFIYYFTIKNPRLKVKSVRYIAETAMIVAVMIFALTPLPEFGFINSYISSLVLYFALLLLPFPFLAFIKEKSPHVFNRWINLLMVFFTLYFLVCWLLQVLGIYDLGETVIVSAILLMTMVAASCGILIYRLVKKKIRFAKTEFIAYTLLFFGCAHITSSYLVNGYVDNKYCFMIFTSAYILIQALLIIYRLSAKLEENQHLTLQLQDSRIQLMMSQIRPNFLYNTLDVIRAMILKSPQKADKMICDLSNYLRSNINTISNSDPIPFSKELEHIETYVNLELVNSSDRLHVNYDIKEKDFFVPPLTIQPLVENAIKHGISKKANGGTVTIKTYKEGQNYIVEIIDDGVGFNYSELSGKIDCCGIKNIKYRILKVIEGSSLYVTSTIGVGTDAKVTIPADYNPKGGNED